MCHAEARRYASSQLGKAEGTLKRCHIANNGKSTGNGVSSSGPSSSLMRAHKFIVRDVLFIAITLAALSLACHREPSRTTDKMSSEFSTDQAKIDYLSRYLKLQTAIEATEFHIQYQDNSGGLVPGPSEWDVQVVMKMKPEDTPVWSKGMKPADNGDVKLLEWGYSLLPRDSRWSIKSKPDVFVGEGGVLVAVFAPEGIVFKRVSAQ